MNIPSDKEIVDWLAKHARFDSESWGYHKGYHTVHIEAPSNWEPGKQDDAPDTSRDFRTACAQAMNPAPKNKRT